MELTIDEYNDFETTAHEIIYTELTENPQQYSREDFHDGLINDLLLLMTTDWLQANIIETEDDADAVVVQVVRTFFAAFYNEFPDRSYPTKPPTLPILPKDRLTNHIAALRSIPQPTQKTIEWHEFRHGLMTASNIWKALASEAQRNSLIYEKCKPLQANNHSFGGGSLQWGIRYEPITIEIYQRIYNTKVEDFGCIRHPTHHFIGASPDGINIDPASDRYGRMIEVKNIVNREITGIPKEEYWTQMQIQMETWDLDECDFIETRFCEYEDEQDYIADTDQEWKGVIWEFQDLTSLEMRTAFQIHPISDQPKSTNQVLYKTTYWYLDEFSCVYVPRNRKWFQSVLPQLETTWNTIVAERQSGYEHRASKKRVPKKPFCLIKLDGLDDQNEISVPISVDETQI
jgi:putative phage-type endonuclease